jgi:DUF1009 family protein
MQKIGLIAGNRRLPLCFAKAAKEKGYEIVAVGIRGDTSLRLKGLVDKLYWLSLSEFGRLAEVFHQEQVKDIVMAGQIRPQRLFSKEVNSSGVLQGLLKNIKNNKADTIFLAIAQKLEDSGLRVLSSTTFMEEMLPGKGTLTACEPEFKSWEDIYFGLEIAKAIALWDIGQTVAVKDKAVVAVEALEGTDNLIRRAGKIAGSGITVVKVSKPRQDARFDVPVVGLLTVQNLLKAKASCLAIEENGYRSSIENSALELK